VWLCVRDAELLHPKEFSGLIGSIDNLLDKRATQRLFIAKARRFGDCFQRRLSCGKVYTGRLYPERLHPSRGRCSEMHFKLASEGSRAHRNNSGQSVYIELLRQVRLNPSGKIPHGRAAHVCLLSQEVLNWGSFPGRRMYSTSV
jgi:hypothetical protein